MARELTDGRLVFLSTLPAGRGERRLALTVVLVSAAIFLTAVPFAKMPLAQISAFIPIYESALVINDLITAGLLFGQFSFLRSRALCVLARRYLFTALMPVSHALTFPGLFSPTGLLGAGPQSTAWLYMLWHGGFPLLVIAYALLKDAGRETGRPRGRAGVAVLASLAAVFVVAGGLTLLATAGQDVLPAIMQGNHYTPAMTLVRSSTWVLSLLALAVLWWRRPHAVLDLWLMVVMCAWLFDIALAAVFNAGRFDLGFYAGRIYGLLAASFVLMVLLLENGKLYARLVEAHESERRERQRVQERTTELTAVNAELALPLAAARSIEMDTTGGALHPQHVWAEQQRLQQVLLNLVSNGIKYNRDGGRLTVACDVAQDGRLRIRVTDTGPGIAPALQERLFQPFDRLGAEPRGVEGTGLGLALSNRLVEG